LARTENAHPWKLLNNRDGLGEVVHKGQVFRGQHEAIIDTSLRDAVQAVLAVNHNERRHATWRKRGSDFLLAGRVVTGQGERLQTSFTTKGRTGQRYRYCVPKPVQALGAKRGHPIGRLAAEPLEELVLAQIHAALQAPYPAEQQRVTRLLIESVVVSEQAVSFVWRDAGWAGLAREQRPDGIGAELRELEAEGAAA
jgi:site-specific DNA recombinase